MIVMGLFSLVLGLVDFLVNLIPNVDLKIGINFIGVIANAFRYANLVIRVDIILLLWPITLLLDHYNFGKALLFFVKKFIPFISG